MTKAPYPNKANIKAAILAGETYAAVAQRYGTSPSVVHDLLRKDPDIVAAKASGALRAKGQPKMTLEGYLADPAVADVIYNKMSTSAAAKKHGISQPAVWNKVKRARDEMNRQIRSAPPEPTAHTPPQDPEIDAIRTLITAYATRHNLTTTSVLDKLAKPIQSGGVLSGPPR